MPKSPDSPLFDLPELSELKNHTVIIWGRISQEHLMVLSGLQIQNFEVVLGLPAKSWALLVYDNDLGAFFVVPFEWIYKSQIDPSLYPILTPDFRLKDGEPHLTSPIAFDQMLEPKNARPSRESVGPKRLNRISK